MSEVRLDNKNDTRKCITNEWTHEKMARRVVIAATCSSGRVKALRVLLLLFQQVSAAVVMRALFPLLLGTSPAKVSLPRLDVAAAEATEDPERAAAAAAAADYSNRRIIGKDRLAENLLSTSRTAYGEEGMGARVDRRDTAGAGAPTINPGVATEKEAVQNEPTWQTAGKPVGRGWAGETAEAKERAPAGTSGWNPQDTAATGRGAVDEAAAAGGSALSYEEAGVPLNSRTTPLSFGRSAAPEPVNGEAAAASGGTDLSVPARRSSPPPNSRKNYAPSQVRKPAAGLERPTAAAALEKTARLSPLAMAAYERAAAASLPRATPATPLADQRPAGAPPPRFASLKRGGTAALERAAAAAAARAGTGSRAASPEVLSENASGSSKKVSPVAPAPPDAPGVSSTGSAALAGGSPAASLTPVPTTAVRPASSSSSISSSSTTPSLLPAPAPAPTAPPAAESVSSFAAALLTGTVRRLAFERCDRYTQKVAITARPGDTIVAECQGAARTIPTDIESFCCRGSCGRCTNKSAVRYNTLYRTGLIPHFRYAAGDGIRSAWRLKIPESLQPPYPTFSVAWLGPAALDIPIESIAGATGIPTATLVIHIEAQRQPEDRLALLRSPGAAAECSVDEPQKKKEEEEDDMLTDEERREEYGRLYERTPFGLRRVSHAPAAAAPLCALQLRFRNGGSGVRHLVPLQEFLRCVPWNVILSAAVTGSIALWT